MPLSGEASTVIRGETVSTFPFRVESFTEGEDPNGLVRQFLDQSSAADRVLSESIIVGLEELTTWGELISAVKNLVSLTRDLETMVEEAVARLDLNGRLQMASMIQASNILTVLEQSPNIASSSQNSPHTKEGVSKVAAGFTLTGSVKLLVGIFLPPVGTIGLGQVACEGITNAALILADP